MSGNGIAAYYHPLSSGMIPHLIMCNNVLQIPYGWEFSSCDPHMCWIAYGACGCADMLIHGYLVMWFGDMWL